MTPAHMQLDERAVGAERLGLQLLFEEAARHAHRAGTLTTVSEAHSRLGHLWMVSQEIE